MTVRQQDDKASFSGGEISPALQAARDLRQYQVSVEKQENMITLVESGMTRRPGTRFLREARDSNQPLKLWPFRRAPGDYAMLMIQPTVLQVMYDTSIVLTAPGGPPFEAILPWNGAQMALLRASPIGDDLIFTSGGARLYKLTRVALNNWTVSEYFSKNGPVGTQNLDKTRTVQPSVVGGAVTLTGIGNPFEVGFIGGVMRIDEANASLTPLWQAGEIVSQPLAPIGAPPTPFGDMADLANLFDGDINSYASKAGASECYAGATYGSPLRFSSLLMRPRVNAGFTNQAGAVRIEVYGKAGGAAPAHGTDGVLLGHTTFADLTNLNSPVSANTSDTDAAFLHIWFRMVQTNPPSSMQCGELVIYARTTYPPVPILRRWEDRIYEAASDGPSGASPPVHDDGDASYGGITWRFRSYTYGFVRITAVPNTNLANGQVIAALPDSALKSPTYRWSPPAWSDGLGWPTLLQQHQQKLQFYRKNRLWATRPTTIDDFRMTADADSAIDIGITSPDGTLAHIQWAAASGIVVLGAVDGEFMLRAPGSNDVLQAQTIDPVNDTTEGSVAQIPAKVDRGVIFVGRDGKRLLYVNFNALTQQLAPEEISIGARHIVIRGVAQTAWQKDPHKILWLRMQDGGLAAVTFMPEQKIIAFHRHPLEGGFVEDVVPLPSLDDSRIDIYLTVRRTINGVLRRYVEILQPFFQPADADQPTAAGAWFLDCALRYQGAPVTRVTGLGHLEGELVGVFADGAMQSDKTVQGAAIDLDAPSGDVLVGKKITWRVRDLPRALQLPTGASRGKAKRANHVVVDVLHAASGKVRVTHPLEERNEDPNDTPFDDLIETGADDYGAAMKLFTGQIDVPVSNDAADEVVVELMGDDALPFTLRALTPDLLVEED